MNKALLPVLAASSLLAGCATDPYGRAQIGDRALVGVLGGAALGAFGGHAVGVNPVTGAIAGAVAGGAAGILIKGPVRNGRQYYKDSRGYCYYVDPNGQPVYDPAVRC